jgi:signal transduction histidine kinase
VVVISDEGPGLSEDDLTRAFHRFQRLSARPTGGESSTGLGLWIVKEIVALHQGRVWITSEGLGKGAQAHVALPLAETVHPQKSEPRGHPIAARF